MRTFIIVAIAGFCLLTGLSLSAGASDTKAKIEQGKGEMEGETKAMKEELKGNDTKAEMERAKGKIKGAGERAKGKMKELKEKVTD